MEVDDRRVAVDEECVSETTREQTTRKHRMHVVRREEDYRWECDEDDDAFGSENAEQTS